MYCSCSVTGQKEFPVYPPEVEKECEIEENINKDVAHTPGSTEPLFLGLPVLTKTTLGVYDHREGHQE